ncbi:MAG: helicase HerA-like domain-containing protein [Alphaproteobacteria bacterium]
MTSLAFADGPNGPASFVLKRINRHGLVTGATGTGKTVTLQNLAEGMARAGIPVFVTDVKGDLSGIAVPKAPGLLTPPAVFWDLMGKQGHPVHTTISEFGPILLGQLLDLSDVQRGVLELVFRVADDNGLLLLDLKDLRAVLQFVADHTQEVSAKYGLVAPATIAAIQRGLLSLENEGAGTFFGEPALELADIMKTDAQGRGYINILSSSELIQRPRLYASFLLWMLAELFEDLPEAGDLPQPKLALFFDEAHLLFSSAPKILLEKVEQVVRLIRSKGVGVYFITQNPADIPENIQGQLGNRVQHCLRAFTPAEQKKVRAAAESLRANPAFDTEKVLGELGVGEALVSMLDEQGVPTVVERVKVRLPDSRLGPLQEMERRQLMMASPVSGKYDTAMDRVSAFEKLQGTGASAAAAAPQQSASTGGWTERHPAPAGKPERIKTTQSDAATGAAWGAAAGIGAIMAKSLLRSASSSVGRQVGNQIMRGLLGAIVKR